MDILLNNADVIAKTPNARIHIVRSANDTAWINCGDLTDEKNDRRWDLYVQSKLA